ncbi:NTP transferase domain-containing protein [Leclercia adecarboxylata]|uniref:NTP transferase domain-containing protein n=1 Tax=Leclercia adecarboxylata TaxID=83655 RepID=UPI002DB58938|nr:NTP transferase domain-containing protein [Leclercia adecarboxylata]MEB6379013.1 NTP transferase domain-containing protein [Leclercia adecarboxylata]
MMLVDCIITAAGLSSRMGRWKMMLPWREGTILDASISNALQFCSRVIVVTGFRAEDLQARYRHQDKVTLVHNPDYENGLVGSVITGVRAVSTDYCFITPGDLPCLHGNIYREMWALRTDGAILPHYHGTPGHPVLIDSPGLQQAIARPDICSMRQALMQGKHRCVDLDHPEIIFDIDTPDDFRRLQLLS